VPAWTVDRPRAVELLAPHDLAFLALGADRVSRGLDAPPRPAPDVAPAPVAVRRARPRPVPRAAAPVRRPRVRLRPQDDPRVLTLF
jgi:hypothetical protein